MKILIDMNLSPRWSRVLEKHGHTCTHWSEVGDPTSSDTIIMRWARENDHIVLTHDLDFGAILASTQASAPSVIQIRTQDVLPPAMERLLAEALQKYETELTEGALIVLDQTRSRIRILPLAH